MIRCIVIDDEPLALTQMSGYVERTPFLELVCPCRSAAQAAGVLANSEVDLMFVDINMPDLNGLDFIRSLESPPIVILATAYSEYALEGFRVSAFDYLLKPFDYDTFLVAAEKARRQHDLIERSRADAPAHIFVRSEYKSVKIELPAVLYIESRSEYVRIYMEDSRPVMTLGSIKSFEERLPGAFMRVHRSFVVNMSKVAHIQRNHITLKDGTRIPVGESYRDLLRDYLNRSTPGRG